MTLDDDIEKIGFTKEDAKKLEDLTSGKYPRPAGGTVGERTLQIILKLLMIMSNDLTAIRELLESGNRVQPK